MYLFFVFHRVNKWEDSMSVKSKDELKKSREEKTRERVEHILSKLEERERNLEESLANLEQDLLVRDFEEKVRVKQSVVAQLELKKENLERKLKERCELTLRLKGDGVKRAEETNVLPVAVSSPKLDLEAVLKKVKKPEKKRFWKFSF
jgi:hypothetical protein